MYNSTTKNDTPHVILLDYFVIRLLAEYQFRIINLINRFVDVIHDKKWSVCLVFMNIKWNVT